jgi:hypothetical protein
MSVTSIEVQGIINIDKTVDIYCPTSGKKLRKHSLRQALMRYLKLQNGSPLCAEIHQRGLLGQVDMVIPNTADAEARFEMFNKQLAGYLSFGALLTFIQEILCRSMDPAVVMRHLSALGTMRPVSSQPLRTIKLKEFCLMSVLFPSSRMFLR